MRSGCVTMYAKDKHCLVRLDANNLRDTQKVCVGQCIGGNFRFVSRTQCGIGIFYIFGMIKQPYIMRYEHVVH